MVLRLLKFENFGLITHGRLIMVKLPKTKHVEVTMLQLIASEILEVKIVKIEEKLIF